MKIKLSIALFFTFLSFFLINNSGGPAEVQERDRTGSPVGTGNCGSCHSADAFSPSIDVRLLDNEIPVQSYVPNQNYILEVEIKSGSGSPSGYGFQTVALLDDNANAGNFTDPGDGNQIILLNDREYLEHSSRSGNNVFRGTWKAPEAGQGSVSFWAAGTAVNSNGQSSGDGAAFLEEGLNIVEGVSSHSIELIAQSDIKVFPNPVSDVLNLEVNSRFDGEVHLSIIDLRGQEVVSFVKASFEAQLITNLGVQNLPHGQYILQFTDGKKKGSYKFLKI